MPSAAPNAAGNFSAPGNGGEGQKVACAGGSQAILEEDLVRWLQQRKGARMRRQAVLTKVLAEAGDSKGRRLARLFALQAFNAGRRRYAHAGGDGRMVPMHGSSARQRAVIAAQCTKTNEKRWYADTQYYWVPTCVATAP
eukprot:COSAG05_NODE_9436_length_623_cov_1.257634_1_plen_139_part_01